MVILHKDKNLMTTLISNLGSREYKKLLNPIKFSSLVEDVPKIRKILEGIVERSGVKIIPQTDVLKRVTWYLDTRDNFLYQNNFTFRRRRETKIIKNKPTEISTVTLKYRSKDYLQSTFVNVEPSVEKNFQIKFEEDVSPLYCSEDSLAIKVSNYSKSCSIKCKEPDFLVLNNYMDLIKFFPSFENGILISPEVSTRNSSFLTRVFCTSGLKIDKAFSNLEIVKNVFFETVCHLFKVEFDLLNKPTEKVVLNFCLSFWHLLGAFEPVAAELSFDFDFPLKSKKLSDNLDLKQHLIVFSNTLFDDINKTLDIDLKNENWVNKKAQTKTALAYTL